MHQSKKLHILGHLQQTLRTLAGRVSASLARWLADLGLALRGGESDYTRGSIGRSVFLLSVPMVLEMVLESVFAVVDVFFVARLGSGAVAVVGITESMLTIVFAIAIGLSAGTTAMVARRIGEGDPAAAGVVTVQAILIGASAALATGLVGFFYAEQLLALVGLDPALIAEGAGYTRVMLTGSVTIYLLFLINAAFRGAGGASLAMRALWLANGINIVLDPCLIFGFGPFPEMGLTGAAVATTIGRGLGVAFQLFILFGGRGRLALERGACRFDAAVFLRLLRISATGILQYLLATASWLGLVKILALFGSAALAGYTIAIRAIVFAILPSWGMSNAAATLVGQNLGAGEPERAERAVKLTAIYNMVFLGTVGLVFAIFAEQIIGLFTKEAEAAAYGVECLRLLSYGYVFYAAGMVTTQAFNGAGDTVTPTLINVFCYWLFEIPLAYLLALPLGFGPTGVFISIPIAEAMLTVTSYLLFRRGRWKTKKV